MALSHPMNKQDKNGAASAVPFFILKCFSILHNTVSQYSNDGIKTFKIPPAPVTGPDK